MRGCRRED